VRVSRPVPPVQGHALPSLLPGQLRRTRPDLPLIDAVDGLSDFIHCPHPGCCALRPLERSGLCPLCQHA
jgi:hypothetical protein